MKVYHGTDNRNITEFKDMEQRNDLDYGRGVYFTSHFNQALKWSGKRSAKGAVYESEIDLSNLSVLDYKDEQEDLFYLLYLCRIDLEDIAKETIDGFGEADVVYGLMLDGNTEKFKELAEQFNEGDLTYKEFYEKIKLHGEPRNQLCLKSDVAIKMLNAGLQKKFYTRKKGKEVIVEYEEKITPNITVE